VDLLCEGYCPFGPDMLAISHQIETVNSRNASDAFRQIAQVQHFLEATSRSRQPELSERRDDCRRIDPALKVHRMNVTQLATSSFFPIVMMSSLQKSLRCIPYFPEASIHGAALSWLLRLHHNNTSGAHISSQPQVARGAHQTSYCEFGPPDQNHMPL
jgi:hypothetical protein